MLSTKVIIVLAAVTFEYCMTLSDAAVFDKISVSSQHEDLSPKELLKKLDDVVTKAVKEGQATIQATRENADIEVPKLQVDLKNQLDSKYHEFTAELDDIKAQADAAGVDASDCIVDAKHLIDYNFDSDYRSANYCILGHDNIVDKETKHGIEGLERFYKKEPKLRRELVNCGGSVKCRNNVIKEITEAIETVPGQIQYDVILTVRTIGADAVKECISKDIDDAADVGVKCVKEAQVCLDKKIHRSSVSGRATV